MYHPPSPSSRPLEDMPPYPWREKISSPIRVQMCVASKLPRPNMQERRNRHPRRPEGSLDMLERVALEKAACMIYTVHTCSCCCRWGTSTVLTPASRGVLLSSIRPSFIITLDRRRRRMSLLPCHCSIEQVSVRRSRDDGWLAPPAMPLPWHQIAVSR